MQIKCPGGQGKVTCPFFDEVDAIFGTRAASCPTLVLERSTGISHIAEDDLDCMSGDSLWVENLQCLYSTRYSLNSLHHHQEVKNEEHLHCEESNSLYFNATIIKFVLPFIASSTPSGDSVPRSGAAASGPSTFTLSYTEHTQIFNLLLPILLFNPFIHPFHPTYLQFPFLTLPFHPTRLLLLTLLFLPPHPQLLMID